MLIPSGTIFADRFRIEKPLAQNGGTATIYLAHLAQDARLKVAVKLAFVDDKSQNTKTNEAILLEREAELLSKWDWRHPGIVRLYPIPRPLHGPEYLLRAVELPGRPHYFVMEYLGGQSLTQNLPRIRKFSLEWKLELFYAICSTIAFLHQKGYAHRDLKPDNIVFRDPISPQTPPQPVLIDFALASNGEDNLQVVEGSYTLIYTPPEQVIKALYDESMAVQPLEADIWSLGVILYEILTGETLFKGDDKKIRTTLIRGNIAEIVQQGSNGMPDILSRFILHMLRKQPDQRPTIKQVIYALEEKFLPPRLETIIK